MYSHGSSKISKLLSRPLHEFLGFASPIILISFVGEIILLYDELPPFHPEISYFIIVKIGKINCFESVGMANV